MSGIDDIFREGLGGRRAEVPGDLWSKIAPATTPNPVDKQFREVLGERTAAVSPALRGRILAAATTAGIPWIRYAVAATVMLFAGATLLLTTTPPELPVGSFPVALTEAPPTERVTASVIENDAPDEAAFVVVDNGQSTLTPRNIVAAEAVVDAPKPTVTTTTSAAASAYATDPLASLPTALLSAKEIAFDLPAPLPSASSFRRSPRRVEGEFLIGAAYANQQFGQSSEGQRPLREARNVSEFPAVTYQFSARLRYQLARNWRLVSGLTFTDIRNRFEYERPSSGGLESSINHLRTLDVPVLLSYRVPGKLNLSLNAGPVLNVAFGADGRFLDPDRPDFGDLAADGGYRNRLGLGWMASLTTLYPIGKSGLDQLMLEPFFRNFGGSFTLPDAPLTERYWVAGLQVGYRRNLR